MATVAVPAQQAREVRELFVDWSRKLGAHIVSEPPESGGGVRGTVNFSCVPEEFLTVLDEEGIRYTKIST
ncbi:hypothetical protein P350_10780 [Burkholderia cepacia JBK9]|nr:hypothetical protein P350_10780 [Burkholderia cepacia JBK9]